MKLFLDIETIPSQREDIKEEVASAISHPGNMKNPETIEKWEKEEKPKVIEENLRKTALDGAYGEVISIAYALDDGEIKGHIRKLEDSEEILIRIFFDSLLSDLIDKYGNTRKIHQWVGHNIINFDLRFLFHRCIISGIRPLIPLPLEAKPWEKEVFDTMIQWAGVGKRISQHKLCVALGIQGKGEIDGSKVWDYIKDGKYDEILEYNKQDVHQVREIYKKLNFS